MTAIAHVLPFRPPPRRLAFTLDAMFVAIRAAVPAGSRWNMITPARGVVEITVTLPLRHAIAFAVRRALRRRVCDAVDRARVAGVLALVRFRWRGLVFAEHHLPMDPIPL